MLKEFWHRIVVSWNPTRYGEVDDTELWKTVAHIPLAAGLAFLLWMILLIPAMMGLGSTIESQLNAFTNLEIGGKVEMVDSISLPTNDPRIVVDVNDRTQIETETVKITREYIYLNTIGGASRIPIEKIQHPLQHKKEFGQFMGMIAVLLMPSIIFWGYVSFMLKYILIVGATTGIALFITHILLIANTSWRRVVNVCIYSATPMVLLETLITPIKGSILLPIFDIMGVNFYGLSMAIYWGLAIAGIYLVDKTEGRPDGKWSF